MGDQIPAVWLPLVWNEVFLKESINMWDGSRTPIERSTTPTLWKVGHRWTNKKHPFVLDLYANLLQNKMKVFTCWTHSMELKNPFGPTVHGKRWVYCLRLQISASLRRWVQNVPIIFLCVLAGHSLSFGGKVDLIRPALPGSHAKIPEGLLSKQRGVGRNNFHLRRKGTLTIKIWTCDEKTWER